MSTIDIMKLPAQVILTNDKGQICVLFKDGSGRAFIFDESQWPDEALEKLAPFCETWTLDGGTE